MRFLQALTQCREAGHVPVIPDLKRRSPKEGDLFRGRTAKDLAAVLQQAGAPVLSCVTEPEHFDGSLSMIGEVAEATGLPVLRKDFIKTEKDIEETARAGAAAVLLIISMLEDGVLPQLLAACGENGLDALVEVHTEAELARVNWLGPPLVGINNRDILRLEKDGGTVENTKNLAAMVKQPAFVVSESAIATPADVGRAVAAGANAVLVGTALLQAEDIGEAYRQLCVVLP